MRNLILLTLFIVTLSSCAQHVIPNKQAGMTLYFSSDPKGALVQAKDTKEVLGRTVPMQGATRILLREYRFTEEQEKIKSEGGCINFGEFIATWPSGAAAESGMIKACGKSSSKHISFSRPKNAPNYDLDWNYGKDISDKIAEMDRKARIMMLEERIRYREQKRGPSETICEEYLGKVRCTTR